MPRTFAASVLFPETDLRVVWIAAISISSSVLPLRPSRVSAFLPWDRTRSLTSIRLLLLKAAARPRSFLSFRTLPGHGFARRASAVSGESPSSLVHVSADILVSRCSAIGSMSSLCFRRGRSVRMKVDHRGISTFHAPSLLRILCGTCRGTCPRAGGGRGGTRRGGKISSHVRAWKDCTRRK